MKHLQTIQKLFGLGRVLCKVVFVLCVADFCGGAVGMLSMALGAPALKIGGVTLESMLKVEAGVAPGTVYAALAAAMILCAGEAVLAKFAERCFRHELCSGTPFCSDWAGELQRLGILTICIPIGTQIAAELVHAVLEQALPEVAPLQLGSSGSAALGVMFLVLSLLCRYGAELREECSGALHGKGKCT